jgi:hypothetical protein
VTTLPPSLPHLTDNADQHGLQNQTTQDLADSPSRLILVVRRLKRIHLLEALHRKSLLLTLHEKLFNLRLGRCVERGAVRCTGERVEASIGEAGALRWWAWVEEALRGLRTWEGGGCTVLGEDVGEGGVELGRTERSGARPGCCQLRGLGVTRRELIDR